MKSFAQLLSPLDVSQFFGEYWDRAPLYVHGDEAKFAHLPGLAQLPSVLAGNLTPNSWVEHIQDAQASFIDRAGNVRSFSAVRSMWPDLFNAGVSLCFPGVDQRDEGLTQLVRGIASTTRLPGKILTNCYLTPPFSGSSMHFDSQHVFFAQVSGKKHWRVSREAAWQNAPINVSLSLLENPALSAFLKSMEVVIPSPEKAGLQELTLNAGDVLYIPPGFWHEAHTSDSHSLHYTLTLAPISPWHLLVMYLRQGAFKSASVRKDMRYTTESGAGNPTTLIEAAIGNLRDTLDGLTAKELEQLFIETGSSDIPLKPYLMLP